MKKIPLRNRKDIIVAFTQVDDDMYDYLMQWQWRLGSGGYADRLACANGHKTRVYVHKLVLAVPSGMFTDHRDRNRLNNQRSNLRIATRSQNNLNVPLRKAKVSQYRGVYRGKSGWEARLYQNGQTIHLGTFALEIEAAKARDQAAIKYLDEFAQLNFPTDMNGSEVVS